MKNAFRRRDNRLITARRRYADIRIIVKPAGDIEGKLYPQTPQQLQISQLAAGLL
jgi:hypothetical protein